MSSQLFKQFIRKAILKQPGPPPRQGLQWKPTTHRWIRPAPQSGDVDQEGPERDDYDLTGKASFQAYSNPFFDGQFADAIEEGGKSGIDTSIGGDYNFEPLKNALREVNDDEWAIEEFINSEEIRSAISNTITGEKFNIADMGEIAKQFIRKAILEKQGPPGPPPRQGLQWKPQTRRWIRPKSNREWEEYAGRQHGAEERKGPVYGTPFTSGTLAHDPSSRPVTPMHVSNKNDRQLMYDFRNTVAAYFSSMSSRDRNNIDRETHMQGALDYMENEIANFPSPEDPNNKVEDLLSWAINEELDEIEKKKRRIFLGTR